MDGHAGQRNSYRSRDSDKRSCGRLSRQSTTRSTSTAGRAPDVLSVAQMSNGVYSNGSSRVMLYGDAIYHEPSEVSVHCIYLYM